MIGSADILLLVTFFLGSEASHSVSIPSEPPSSLATSRTQDAATAEALPSLILPRGERILLRLEESLDTRSAQQGRPCRMALAHEIIVSLKPGLVIPAGVKITATVEESRGRRNLFRKASLKFRFGWLHFSDGRQIDFPARMIRMTGPCFREGSHLVVGEGTWIEVELLHDWMVPADRNILEEFRPNPSAVPASLSSPESPDVALNPEARTTRATNLRDAGQRNALTPRFVTQVNRVILEALVRDGHGRPVEGLRRTDFQLFEDGEERSPAEFGTDTKPLAVALVLDSSGSIQPFKAQMKAATRQALTQLSDRDQACLFTFAVETERVVDLTTDRRLIADRCEEVGSEGKTNIFDALFNASLYLREAGTGMQHAIILISDNMTNEIGRNGEGATLRMAMESDTVICSLRLPGALPLADNPSMTDWFGDKDLVGRMVRATGGEIIELSKTRSLASALETILSRLKRRYLISFEPGGAPETSFHHLSLRLVPRFGKPGKDYTVTTREGYFSARVAIGREAGPN